MPRLDIPEPPFITSLSKKENDTLNEWLLQIHNLLSGIGDDGTPLLDDDNIASLNLTTVTGTTDDLAEGESNLYYASGSFDADFASKDTGDLSEGSNLYYTDARGQSSAGTYHNAISGSNSSLNQSASDADSTAGDVNTLVVDHNDLLAKLRTAGLLAT